MIKNTNKCMQEFGPLMQEYARKDVVMSQTRRIIISSFELTNGTAIIPLLLIYLQLGLVCTNVYRFNEYTPVKSFNDVEKYAVNACCQEDDNPSSCVDAETMKLPEANSSYSCQIMDRSRQKVTIYMSDRKAQAAINKKRSRDCDISTIYFTRRSLPNLEWKKNYCELLEPAKR